MADPAQHAPDQAVAGAHVTAEVPAFEVAAAPDAVALEAGRLLSRASAHSSLVPSSWTAAAVRGPRGGVCRPVQCRQVVAAECADRAQALARVSQEPGRTRQLNFFNLANRLTLVDMPGYGYARASKDIKADWQGMMFDYLRGRPTAPGRAAAGCAH